MSVLMMAVVTKSLYGGLMWGTSNINGFVIVWAG